MSVSERKQQDTVLPTAIIPGRLYLGSYDTASRSEILKAMGITHILNVRWLRPAAATWGRGQGKDPVHEGPGRGAGAGAGGHGGFGGKVAQGQGGYCLASSVVGNAVGG